MKKTFFVWLIFMVTTTAFATELQDKLATLLNNPKEAYKLQVKYDPFIQSQDLINSAVDTTTSKVNTLHVSAIFNNKAFIESAWREEGDEILGYKIIKINPNEVLSKKEGKLVKLELQPSNTLLKVRKIEK